MVFRLGGLAIWVIANIEVYIAAVVSPGIAGRDGFPRGDLEREPPKDLLYLLGSIYGPYIYWCLFWRKSGAL